MALRIRTPPIFSPAAPALLKDPSGLSPLDVPDKKSSEAEVVGTSLPLPVPSKPESVVSITSQCSYSSTIVHVGDKKPQPDSGTSTKGCACRAGLKRRAITPELFVHTEMIEDIPGTGETAESGQSTCARPPPSLTPPGQERGGYKKLGLTKQVLAAHTQKEEQAFLCRFRELSSLKENCSQYLERRRQQLTSNGTSQEGWAIDHAKVDQSAKKTIVTTASQ